MGRSLGAKVNSIIHNGGWHWPQRRNAAITEIINNTAASLIPGEANEDRVIWSLSPTGVFTSKSTSSAIRTKAKGLVPRWAFILWVAILGRLATRDRLRTWGVTLDSGCVLCAGGLESHNHLFFACSFALQVWTEVKSQCGYAQIFSSLSFELTWGGSRCKGASLKQSMYKLCLAASVYHIWRERNGRILGTTVWTLLVWLIELWVMSLLASVHGEGSLPLLRIKIWALLGAFPAGCSSNLRFPLFFSLC